MRKVSEKVLAKILRICSRSSCQKFGLLSFVNFEPKEMLLFGLEASFLAEFSLPNDVKCNQSEKLLQLLKYFRPLCKF